MCSLFRKVTLLQCLVCATADNHFSEGENHDTFWTAEKIINRFNEKIIITKQCKFVKGKRYQDDKTIADFFLSNYISGSELLP